MFNLVIFGAPGSGKGTQSEKLTKEYGLYHISTGDVLRSHIARGTDLGKVAQGYIANGQLIPDDLMVSILAEVMDKNPEAAGGVIFDGFPRTINQAKALKTMLEARGAKVDAVIGLEVEEEELVARLLNRGKESGRSDDNLQTIKRRLEVYHSQTQPLQEYYMGQGNYHAIKGSGSVEGIFAQIKARVDSCKG